MHEYEEIAKLPAPCRLSSVLGWLVKATNRTTVTKPFLSRHLGTQEHKPPFAVGNRFRFRSGRSTERATRRLLVFTSLVAADKLNSGISRTRKKGSSCAQNVSILRPD